MGSSVISRRRFLGTGVALATGVALGARTPAFGQAAAADLVLRNGRVLTLVGEGVAQAVAVSGGRIVFVGSDAGAQALVGPATEVIDAGGRMVMPGIHDGHTHALAGGLALTKPTLNYRQLNLRRFVAAVGRLLERTRDQEPDGWLSVDLWDATAMDRQPTKADLDALDTRRPLIVVSLDGHIAVANSRALEIAGITASTRDPRGGTIRRGPGREPTGILLDDAIGLVLEKVPPLTPEQNAAALLAGHEAIAAQGITAYMDASVGRTELAALAALSDRGALNVRPSAAVLVTPRRAEDPAAMLEYLAGLRAEFGRPDVGIRTVKMFFDGVIEHPTQTAALLEPYRVNRGSRRHPHFVGGRDRGPTYFEQRVADRAIAALDGAGWQVHVHAIGDRAVRSALDAFEHARRRNGRRGNRHTITHLELVHPRDFPRFRRLGVLASMQLQWAGRDSYTVDSLRPYIGRRWRYTYPAGSLARAGAMLCGGSDWPVDPLLPFRQIEMAVNRTADEVYEGYPKPLFRRQEGLSLRDSIAMHTRHAAFQLHLDRVSGRIREGLAADLVVLDRDLLRAPLRRVSNTKAVLTMVGGRVVHRTLG